MIDTFTVTRTYEISIDTDTNEIKSCKVIEEKKKPSNKRTGKIAELESNKLVLTDDIINMMNLKTGDKVEIRYEFSDGVTYPVIASSEAFGVQSGTRLTKDGTIALRGKRNEELARFGTVFNVVPYPDHEDLFLLQGDRAKDIQEIELDSDLPIDLEDIPEIIDDDEIIDTEFFK